MSVWKKIWPIAPIPAPPNPVRIGENKIKDEIEEALKNDLNADALEALTAWPLIIQAKMFLTISIPLNRGMI